MHAGVAPLPAASGRSHRHRLNRRGNRQLNSALHRLAVSQLRLHEPAKLYVARKRAEGKSMREALRCLERHLAKTVWRSSAGPSSGARRRLLQRWSCPQLWRLVDIGAMKAEHTSGRKRAGRRPGEWAAAGSVS